MAMGAGGDKDDWKWALGPDRAAGPLETVINQHSAAVSRTQATALPPLLLQLLPGGHFAKKDILGLPRQIAFIWNAMCHPSNQKCPNGEANGMVVNPLTQPRRMLGLTLLVVLLSKPFAKQRQSD